MTYTSKLKPDHSLLGLLPVLLIIFVFLGTFILFGVGAAYIILSCIVLIIAIQTFVGFLRIRNNIYFLQALAIFFEFLWFASWPGSLFGFSHDRYAAFFTLCTFFTFILLFAMVLNRKFKWRGREILELAAMPVDEATNGFTERPYPSGRIECSRRDIYSFAEFCLRSLIAWPYVEENRIVFVPLSMSRSMRYIYGLGIPGYEEQTWVAFHFDGTVSVSITKKDYLTYKEDLAFEKLCESLGDIFVEFLELYRRGDESRIFDRMDSLRLSLFS